MRFVTSTVNMLVGLRQISLLCLLMWSALGSVLERPLADTMANEVEQPLNRIKRQEDVEPPADQVSDELKTVDDPENSDFGSDAVDDIPSDYEAEIGEEVQNDDDDEDQDEEQDLDDDYQGEDADDDAIDDDDYGDDDDDENIGLDDEEDEGLENDEQYGTDDYAPEDYGPDVMVNHGEDYGPNLGEDYGPSLNEDDDLNMALVTSEENIDEDPASTDDEYTDGNTTAMQYDTVDPDNSYDGDVIWETDTMENATEVMEPDTPEDNENSICGSFEYGCCAGTDIPAHGPRQEGCCLTSANGCCPDNIRPAEDELGSNCGCDSTEFGCCPDGNTVRRGSNNEGCGCAGTEFGCCQDLHTVAEGPEFGGCPCHTFDFGCCPDGTTVAGGPNKENCIGCDGSEFGCCPDGFTAATGPDMEGCGCAGSEFGCCPDGETTAEGPDFAGCASQPGEACSLPEIKGPCQNFSVRWFFDMKEGRCSRFWYGGCDGNANNFPNAASCERMCVNPPGSAKCYLPAIKGICAGKYASYFYDHGYKQCVPFEYGGCLGNANRFESRQNCEQSCVKSEALAVCEQPVEHGACMGNYSRWHFNEKTGECDYFAYGGCQGNQNRFQSKAECENSCSHRMVALKQTMRCKQPISSGNCNETIARWGFFESMRRCVPFYYTGCEGNSNNFLSQQECEEQCPNSFSPELEVVTKILNIEEGQEAVLQVRVEGNPFPSITWHHNGEPVEPNDRVQVRQDQSLVLTKTVLEDTGSWMVLANNGVGKSVRKDISLTVYPASIPLKVEILSENTTFEAGTNIKLGCKVEGYPKPKLEWLKNNARLPRSNRIVKEDENTLVINNASPIDGGVYICRATNEQMQEQAHIQIGVMPGKARVQCTDSPHLANCKLIVRVKYCAKNKNLARLCCKSCTEDGQISGPPE